MRGQLLICDFAQVALGKLTAVGAGWDTLQLAGADPGRVYLGGIIFVAEDEPAGHHRFRVALISPQGETVVFRGRPIEGGGEFQTQGGEAARAAFALGFLGLHLPEGEFSFRLEVDGELLAEEMFRVVHVEGTTVPDATAVETTDG